MENYIVSARKYRPSTFASVVGQKALTATLRNSISKNRLAHAYLFCGSRGVGKTSCARIFAKTINCRHRNADGEACNECDSCREFNKGASLNIVELDAASNNGIDDMKNIIDQVQVPPVNADYRVFIIDEVHMLSNAAFNAFLKTLEEPPSYVVFILATTEKHKVLPTILSRCQIYDFNRITIQDMVDHLSYVATQEGIIAEPAALNVIARKADGAMRDALSIFDQVAASSRGNITYAGTIENLNVLDSNYYNRLLDCFLQGKTLETWLIYKEIRDKGFDSHFFINGLADYMRDLMVAREPSTIVLLEADDEVRNAMAQRAAKCHPEFIYRAMNLCNEADLNYRTASNKQFLVELTLAKICQLLSPSPVNSGEGEGQLQNIAANGAANATRPQQQQQQQPQQPQQQPQPAARPAAPLGTSRPSAVPSRPTVKLGTGKTFSITGRNTANGAASNAQGQGTSATQLRDAKYTVEQLNAGWQAFMKANPTYHILVNTMRASYPALVEGHTYRVMVENEKQREELETHMQPLLATLRDATANDHISIIIELNQGEASPHTWNEREVLQHMVEKNPEMRDFIESLQLSIG